MNSLIKRLLPPGIVVATATYVGWPPPEPLDLGEDFVTAKSVGWRPADLDSVPLQKLERDPLSPVLVSLPEAADAALSIDFESIGEANTAGQPTEEEVRLAHRLSGVVSTSGKSWAILNVGLKCVGDHWPMPGSDEVDCEIVSITGDQVEVRSGSVTVKLKSVESPSLRQASRRRTAVAKAQSANPSGSESDRKNMRAVPVVPGAGPSAGSSALPAEAASTAQRANSGDAPSVDTDASPAV